MFVKLWLAEQCRYTWYCCRSSSDLLQRSNMFPHFVEEGVFLLQLHRSQCLLSFSPWPLAWKREQRVLNLTADEPSVQGTSVGQVFPVLTDGCQRTGAGTLSSGLLQIRLPGDVEKFEGNMCSQTHLNTCECLCASSSCLNPSNNTCAVSLLSHSSSFQPFPRCQAPASCFYPCSCHHVILGKTSNRIWISRFLKNISTWRQQ